MSRTGIAALAALVLFIAVLGFFAIRGPGEPTPTADLTAEQLVERVSERTPNDTLDCGDMLDKYAAYESVNQSNAYNLFASWLDSDDPPTREQVDGLLAHCQEQGQ